jgi:hypothetical protein
MGLLNPPDAEPGHGTQRSDRHRPALSGLIVGWVLALCAVPWWLVVAFYGLVGGRIGDCWPTDMSDRRWIPVVMFGLAGVVCDLGVFYGLIRRDRLWLYRAEALSLLILALFLLLGPTGVALIGSKAPHQC